MKYEWYKRNRHTGKFNNTRIQRRGGTFNAAVALGEGVISKNAYTETVVRNAEEFRRETESVFPSAVFGVSVLASSINPEKMKGLIGSVDYPYVINWGLDFLKEKIEKI